MLLRSLVWIVLPMAIGRLTTGDVCAQRGLDLYGSIVLSAYSGGRIDRTSETVSADGPLGLKLGVMWTDSSGLLCAFFGTQLRSFDYYYRSPLSALGGSSRTYLDVTMVQVSAGLGPLIPTSRRSVARSFVHPRFSLSYTAFAQGSGVREGESMGHRNEEHFDGDVRSEMTKVEAQLGLHIATVFGPLERRTWRFDAGFSVGFMNLVEQGGARSFDFSFTAAIPLFRG